MFRWQKQARAKAIGAVRMAAATLGLFASCNFVFATFAVADTQLAPLAEPAADLLSKLFIGGLVLFSLMSAIIVSVLATLQKMRRASRRKSALVNSTLNRIKQGIVMVDKDKKVVFCNDRYLGMYGLSRSDIPPGTTSAQLVELRGQRNVLGHSVEDFLRLIDSSAAHISDLPDGRTISVQHQKFANGVLFSIHEDCTEERRMSRQVELSNNFLEAVIDNIPLGVSVCCVSDGRYILANRCFEQIAKEPREKILGRTAHEIFTPEIAEVVGRIDRNALMSEDGRCCSETVLPQEYGSRTLRAHRIVIYDEKHQPEYILSLHEDVTSTKALTLELQETKKFLELIVDNIPSAVIVRNLIDQKYLLVNRAAEEILGHTRDQVIGRLVEDIHPDTFAQHILSLDKAAVRKGSLVSEDDAVQMNDGLHLFTTRRVLVKDDAGNPKYLVKTLEDATKRRETECRLARMAYYDPLTDLPNRVAFLQSLEQIIESCQNAQDSFAVVSTDLDRLKDINDVFGQDVGDRLIVEISRRIETAARVGMVARLSGDEFGLIIEGPQPDAAKAVVAAISEAMQSEFLIDGKSIHASLSMGVAVFPQDGTTPATLLSNADAALFRTKAKSRGAISFFKAEMDQQTRDRRTLHQELSAAVKNGDLSLHYQPLAKSAQVLDKDDVVGFEALARWIHPTRGFVPPCDFIPLAEDSGLIVAMGEWILREACREAASWPKPLQIAVNLSPVQFLHGDLVGLVHSILLETGLSPDRLELEITEGVLIEDFDRGLSLLRRLSALGVQIAMDDFGSGYSSLTYLQAFPFDKIKLDREFVVNIGRNAQSAAIIRAMINLCHSLDVSITAEGVETQTQLAFLAAEGCDQIQGYFFGKPAPIAQYASWVGRADPAASEASRKTG
jgi:diguanylate cyclase (GGDEF)-like protein/PAS domain S-box-containing protein